MMIFCKENKITINDLPPSLFLKEESLQKEKRGTVRLIKMVSDIENKWIISKLKESDWNKEKAAKLLGITRKMLDNRIKKYNIKPPKINSNRTKIRQ